MSQKAFLSICIVGVLSVGSTLAHHAATPVYDMSRTTTVEGVVTEFRFVNPHSMMTMEVKDSSGTVTKFVVEFAGRLNLSEVGWTADTIKTGERVTVTGNPTWERLPRLFFRRIVRADGTELVQSQAQRAGAIEEERKQRIRERERPK
jgi:hypothetical protein